MKIAAFALSAALLGLASLTPAAAAPASSAAGAGLASGKAGIVDVQYKGKRDGKDWDGDGHKHRHGYRPGGRYKRAPHGWHRHSHRPRDWRTRGCIAVGPVWFCP